MRGIRLNDETGESVVAHLLDNEAPAVCDFIWSRLPLEGRTLHGMFSGPEVVILLRDPQPGARENMVHLPLPGELLYSYDDGSAGVGARGPLGGISLVYGRGEQLKDQEGVPTRAALFARIPGDWKYDWLGFAAACRKSRWEGPQLLRMESVVG